MDPDNAGLKSLTHVSPAPPATADGFTVIDFVAVADVNQLPPSATVSFTTTAGTFLPAGTSLSVPIDATGRAVAQLRAPTDSAFASVTATFAGVTQFDSIAFSRALPDRIVLATDHVTLQPAAATGASTIAKLTIGAFRTFGSPSPGQPILLSAYVPGDTTQHRGIVNPGIVYSAAAPASASFFADTAAAGIVRIRAQMIGIKGLIADSVDIEIIR